MKDAIKYTRGKNLKSKKKRIYTINDDFFANPNLLNCYYAGWLAADGNVSDKGYLNVGISEKDIGIFENFLTDAESNYKISKHLAKGLFPSIAIKIKSNKICHDLSNNFNITPRKSSTLKPPNITDTNLIDAFIVGYIDGDGCICLSDGKKQKALSIDVIGTLEILKWIRTRFSQISGRSILAMHKKGENNTVGFNISDKTARSVFTHLYKVGVPKMSRKWSLEKYNHAISFKKYENIDKYKKIFNLITSGKSQKEVSVILDISQAAVSWYTKRDTYKKLVKDNVLQIPPYTTPTL